MRADHAASGDGGRRGVVDVVRLEDDLAVVRHGQPVAVGQRQRSVVVQHRVEVLDPQRVHRTVQHDPHVLTALVGRLVSTNPNREPPSAHQWPSIIRSNRGLSQYIATACSLK